MSGKFVRQSKYRHLWGNMAKKEKSYQNVKVECTGEGNHITANTTFFACAVSGGGGPVLVHPLAKFGRVDHNAPKLNLHKSKVVDIEFSPFLNTLIATAAEDCLIKLTIVPEGGLKETVNESNATLEGHQKKLSMLHFNPTANNILGSVGYDNAVKIWDIEKQKEVLSFDDHPDLPQSFEWNDDGSQIATYCKDKNVRMYDPRNKSSVAKSASLDGSKGARVVWLGGTRFAAVGFNKQSARQYVVYDTKKLDTPLITTDIDSSAGLMIPFFDSDNQVLYMCGKGDAAIHYWEVVDSDPYLYYLTNFRDNESAKGACFLPKLSCEVKSCEVAVALRVMKDWISPVSFVVPRKSDVFQSDIFPDAYAGKPAQTADEWLAGGNKPPIKRSMDPKKNKDEKKDDSKDGGMSFSSSKSKGDLEKELEKANARIKELEDLVAKLQTSSTSASTTS